MQETAFKEVDSVCIAHPSEILSLTFDAASNYLAVTNRDGIVQLYALAAMMKIRNIFSISISSKDILKAIAFGHMGSNSRNLLVFGLNHGTM